MRNRKVLIDLVLNKHDFSHSKIGTHQKFKGREFWTPHASQGREFKNPMANYAIYKQRGLNINYFKHILSNSLQLA